MLNAELIVVAGDYILVDDGNLPSLPILPNVRANDLADELMYSYTGIKNNWYVKIQCGLIDGDEVNGEIERCVLYLIVLDEKVPLKCNLANWANFFDVNKKTQTKISYATTFFLNNKT